MAKRRERSGLEKDSFEDDGRTIVNSGFRVYTLSERAGLLIIEKGEGNRIKRFEPNSKKKGALYSWGL